ncbi:MAG: hypothetical protein C0404_07080 [Verrucomicrobia bacterium]|nr:hypothetical protein [Verrucomicrobiota bacterium]
MQTTEFDKRQERLDGNSYRFGRNGEYEIIVARRLAERKRAWAMVYRMYREKGYAEPDTDGLWYGLYDALPQTTTFLVTRDGVEVATLTTVFDSEFGLPADTVYKDELDAMRRNGRRLCEIVSLSSEEKDRRQCVEVLKHMFKVGYLMACKLSDATDFIITVNPHHSSYYEKKLLFHRQGCERSYQKVGGAAAVLLCLDLETAPGRYVERYGLEEGSLGSHFLDSGTVSSSIWFLAGSITEEGLPDLMQWFRLKKPFVLTQLNRSVSPFDVSQFRHEPCSAGICRLEF